MEVRVPDIGDFDAVEVIEILVAVGDQLAVDDSIVTLESDKASMEVPAPAAGTVKSIAVKLGDEVSEGTVLIELDAAEQAAARAEASASSAEEGAVPAPPAAGEPREQESAREEQPEEQRDEPQEESVESPPEAPETEEQRQSETPGAKSAQPLPLATRVARSDGLLPHASPGVRRFARELGVDLAQVAGSGPKERILKEDVQAYVKRALQSSTAAQTQAGSGQGIPAVPAVDFSKFGEVEEVELSRIRKLSAANLHRSWLNVPHVTQFDEADITDLEDFRRQIKGEAAQRDVKVTPLAFLLKAAVAALRAFPDFNSSLHPSGEKLIRKHYLHIGVAVDTDDGLVVPVIRNVDQKGVFELAAELATLSQRARDGKLKLTDIQGASFTISSLGGIGGTGFTPIVNAPEVAILGVARSKMQPVFVDGEFVPRLILPFSVSYDHRVIDGATAVRFTTYYASVLSDMRRLVL